MDAIRWFLLESVIAQAIAFGLISFITLVIWRRGGPSRPFLVSISLWAVAFLLQTLITTPGEAARAVMADVEQAVVRADVDTIARHLSAVFETSPPTAGAAAMDRAAFLSFVRTQLDRVDPHWVRRTRFKLVEAADDRSVCEFSYMSDVSSRDFQFTVPSRWRIAFAKEASRWRIVSIEPLEIGPRGGGGWRMANQ